MDDSQRIAAAVAERALGKPVRVVKGGAKVVDVGGGSPAARAGVQATDVITSVEQHARVVGRRAPDGDEQGPRREPGDADGRPRRRAPHAAGRYDAGAARRPGSARRRGGGRPRNSAPRAREVPPRLERNLVGPSAGSLRAPDLRHARRPSEPRPPPSSQRGELDADGNVLDVGAAKQKAYGAALAHAEVYVLPAGNAAEAASARRRGLRVIGVKTFRPGRHGSSANPALNPPHFPIPHAVRVLAFTGESRHPLSSWRDGVGGSPRRSRRTWEEIVQCSCSHVR